MNEMIGYIFSGLHSSETSIKNINKTLTRQAKINMLVTVLAIFASMQLYVDNARLKKQSEKIKALEKEIDKLKGSKGE